MVCAVLKKIRQFDEWGIQTTNFVETKNHQISRRIEKKFPTGSGTRQPRNQDGKSRSKRQLSDNSTTSADQQNQEKQMKSLMEKANFDRKTFLFGLGIVQNRVTDINNATVRELQALRDGLTINAVKDLCPMITSQVNNDFLTTSFV